MRAVYPKHSAHRFGVGWALIYLEWKECNLRFVRISYAYNQTMKRVLHKAARHLKSYFSNDVSAIEFLMGQSSILVSRSMSDRFEHLWDAEVKVFSQWGEDGILDYLCQALDISKPKVLEIGAGNFRECNSRFLAENRNASVFAVDGRDDLNSEIHQNSLRWKTHIFSMQEWITPKNINNVIKTAQESMSGIDVFSLDLDGNDFWILDEANLQGVSIVVVEYNPLFGSKLAVSVPRDDRFDRTTKHFSWLYYGASLNAFIETLSQKDFVFIGTNRVGSNGFFVRKSIVNRIKLTIPKDLSLYVDWRIRESRDQHGKLDYLSKNNRIDLIKDMPLINILDGSEIQVKDLL